MFSYKPRKADDVKKNSDHSMIQMRTHFYKTKDIPSTFMLS